MTQSFMGDKQCWMEHMALNSTDGLDPEGIRLRASEGLLGVDYFFPGYAVWAGLIEAAADLGYDTNNLVSCLSCVRIMLLEQVSLRRRLPLATIPITGNHHCPVHVIPRADVLAWSAFTVRKHTLAAWAQHS